MLPTDGVPDMKRTLFALLFVVFLAGCAHQQSGYAGGGGGYFAGDCLSSYGCNDEYYRQGYFFGYSVLPSSPARARVAKLERNISTRVVARSAVAPTRGTRSVSALSRPFASTRSAPAAASHSSHSGGHR
jgi:hypothetical protein